MTRVGTISQLPEEVNNYICRLNLGSQMTIWSMLFVLVDNGLTIPMLPFMSFCSGTTFIRSITFVKIAMVVIERKLCIRAVYYLPNSIDRQTSLEIRAFSLLGPDPFDKSQDRCGILECIYGARM